MYLDKLKLLNFKAGSHLNFNLGGQALIIKTCQRIMVISMSEQISHQKAHVGCTDFLSGSSAYQFLLETICGLKSKILAEYEIVSQFKQDFQTFLSLTNRDSRLIKVMEKLLKDAKEVRTHFLLGICQLSYAGISRQLLLKNCIDDSTSKQKVVICGTGKLAEDLIKILFKKFDLIVIGRNKARLEELSKSFNIIPKEISQLGSLVNESFIINTIGAEEVLFDDLFFKTWQSLQKSKKIFIDLGSPSSIRTSLKIESDVYHLEDIFSETSKLTKDNFDKINNAFLHIQFLVNKRETLLTQKNEFVAQIGLIN